MRTICTSRRFVRTAGPMGRRHGFGRSSSATRFMSGPTTDNSRWYRAALALKAGRITAAGMTKEVAFEPAEEAVNGRIDDAYRAKYRGSPYLNPIIGARARSATVKVTPRTADF